MGLLLPSQQSAIEIGENDADTDSHGDARPIGAVPIEFYHEQSQAGMVQGKHHGNIQNAGTVTEC